MLVFFTYLSKRIIAIEPVVGHLNQFQFIVA